MTAEISNNGSAATLPGSPARARLPAWAPATVIIIVLLARVAFSLFVPPNEDEAYYFAWGQHLQLSYYDHAPLHGWMQGLSTAIFGWSHWAMRAMSFVTLAATAAIFWYWAGRLAPMDRTNFFLTSLAIYMASPVVFAISVLAFPDHWLMFLSLASIHFFALFFAERLATGRETVVALDEYVPVHLVYRTAYTQAKGNIQFRNDVYGRDAAIWKALERTGVSLRAVQG